MTRDLFGRPVWPAGRGGSPGRQLGLPLRLAGTGGGAPFRLQLCIGMEGMDMGQVTDGLQGESAIGGRWAAALRRRCPAPNTAKQVARALDCDVRTAEAWLAGQAPYARMLVRAWRRWGAGIVAEVLAPGVDLGSAADLDAALAEIERRVARLGAELARLKLERER